MKDIQVVFFGNRRIQQAIDHSLNSNHRISVAASTGSSVALFPLLEQHNPQLVVLENRQERANILPLIRKIRRRYPLLKLLILAHSIDISQVREWISIGVSGCLLLKTSLDGLAASIHLILDGKLILSSEIMQALLSVD